MANVALTPEIADEVPWSDQVTDYDQQHLVVYLRLLDARSAGASDTEIAQIVLGIDPQREPERAQKALMSHIRRAQWMTAHGYKQFLQTE